MVVNLFLSPITFLLFLTYLVWEVCSQLKTKEKDTAEEMGRRVVAISAGFVFAAYSLSTLYAQVSDLVSSPWFDGPGLTVIWLVSVYLYFR